MAADGKGPFVSYGCIYEIQIGDMSSITAREAEGFFRIDAYVGKSAMENKILRVLNAFSDDREIRRL